ncbi:MAG: T9SS type A sorting domain-containing protein [Bacteroidia bacterium]
MRKLYTFLIVFTILIPQTAIKAEVVSSLKADFTTNSGINQKETAVSQSLKMAPPIGITGSLSFCTGSSTVLDAGPGYISYLWNNGSSNQTLTVSVGGTYTVTVTDTNSIVTVDSVTVTENPNPTPTISGNLSFCTGSSTILDAGSGYSSYLWDNSSTNQTLTVNTASPYTVTVTDGNGCSGSTSVTVIENLLSTTNLAADGPLVFCDGGTVNISADAGYSAYNWSTGQSTQSVDINTSGTYTVTVTDANSCTTSTSVTVTVNPNPIINIVSQTNVDCNGNATGIFEVSASGGTGPYKYSLDGGPYQSSGIFGVLAVGNYLVSVIDSATDCSSSIIINVTEPDAITAISSQVDLLCYDRPTGSIDITVFGGTLPYTYDWSNGSTDEDISLLVAGFYTVTITDANGCIYSNVYEIIQPTQITIGTQQTNVSCSYGADGTAFVDVDGGTPGYTYLWDDGQTDQFAFGLDGGLHTVTITDANGCDTLMTFLISVPPQLNSSSVATDVSCYGACDGSITLNIYGGTPYSVGALYDVVWNTIPVQTGPTATGLCAGTYTAIITDSAGCVKYHVETIDEPTQLVVSITPDPANCNGASNGEATANVIGGTPLYFYIWSDGQLTQTATGLPAGTYTVTVTDYNGCSATKSVIIGQPTSINVSGVITNVKCNGAITGKVILTITGGSGGYTYFWNTLPVITTKNLNNVAAGTYTVIVTDNSGCTVSATFTITEPFPIACNGTVNDVSCNSTNNGSIIISPTGGTSPFTIIWSNGNTTTSNTGLLIGTYTVTITDINNCTTSCTFTVVQSPGMTINGSVQNVTCFGASNGHITAQPTGGISPYIYLWSNGGTNQTITGLSGGTYTVTVTDSVGCTNTASFTVLEPAELSCICNANVHNVSCFGGSDGSITAQPIGGTPPYSYVWSNGAFTQTISGLIAGTYTVTITDASGCQKIGVVQVNQPTQLFATISCVNNATCFGNNNGSACVTGFGGTPPYTYSWNTIPIQTTFSATGLTGGTYTATVTDANNCTATASVTITQPSTSVSCSITKTNVVCFGQSNGSATVNPTGGTPPYSYLWNTSPIKTTKTVLGLSAGTYTVVVTDSKGCSSNCSITITQPPQLLALASVTNVTCNGGTNGAIDLTVTGGNPPYSYNWSNGATTQDLTGLSAGSYQVTITDNKGCIAILNFVIIQPSHLSCSTIATNVSCNGGSNGSGTVTATGGLPPYSYIWSNGGINATETGLPAGTYTVTVTDANGCTTTCSLSVTQPPVLSCNVVLIQNETCNGHNGQLQVNATGGTSPYSYSWTTSPVQTTAVATGLSPGTYSVLVTDSKGCNTICSGTVGGTLTVTCNITGTNVTCNGGNNGTATVNPSGGTPPYTYLWNTATAATTASVSGLTAGNYTATVTDANGCTSNCSIIITQPALITILISANNVTCNGGNNGNATANASGGVPPYGYLWSNGQTTHTATGLIAGTYTVTVTDASGCTKTASTTITQPSAISCSTTSTNVSCFGGNNGTATVTTSGGTGALTINWNTIPAQTSLTATGLTAGIYTVTITDINGCTSSCTAEITQPTSSVSCTTSLINNATCYGGNNGSASVSASGGSAPYSYNWNTIPVQTTSTATGLSAGTYTVTVTDALGCTSACTVVIGQPSQLSCTVNPINTSCGLDNGQVTVIPNGGTPSYLFLWSNGSTDQTLTSLPAGTYTVTVTDANGCTSTCEGSVNSSSEVIFTTIHTNLTCNGVCNGTANVDQILGGVPPYSYLWSNGSTNASATLLCAQTYTVTVSDVTGCSATATVVITEPTPIVLTFTNVINVACNGGNNGQAKVNPTGGTPAYTYLWSNGQTTQTATGLVAGTYSVTVTDSKGCTAVDSVLINQSGGLTYTQSQTNVSCNGGNNGTATVNPSGGTPPYSYLWSNGQTTQTATGLSAGHYTVEISDANGCNIIADFDITQPTALSCGISQSNPSCNGSSDGFATVVASGGTTPYTFLWSNGQTTQTATGLSAGTYTVTVTDANSCTSSCSVTLTNPSVISCSVSTTPVSCSGGNNGTATVTPTGGTPPYTYLWSNGQTTLTATGLSLGTYSVTVTDQYGCSSSCSGSVSEILPITISFINVVNSTCGLNNGSAEAVASGGTPPYNYVWSNGTLGSTIINVGGGTYTVTVTDANGCSGIDSLILTETSALSITLSGTDPSCFGGSDGTVTVVVTGGSGVYTYQWNSVPAQTTSTATGLTAGTYCVLVTDQDGCTAYDSVKLVNPPLLLCSVTPTDASCSLNNGSVTVTPTGGTLPYSYLWSDGSTDATITGLGAGTYTVTVTDGHNCTTSCSATVNATNSPSCLITGNSTICSGGSTQWCAPAGLASYLWSTGATTQCIAVSATGTYTVTVTNASGCTSSCNKTLTTGTLPSCLITGAGSICTGSSTQWCAPAGLASYLWSTGATTQCITVSASGTYTVTTTNTSSCTKSCSKTLTLKALPNCTITATGSLCATGSSQLCANAGMASYLWSTGVTTQCITVTIGGTYTVTVTNANGCTSSCSKIVTGGSPITAVVITKTNVSCNGGSNGNACVTSITGGTSPYAYLWSNGITNSCIINLSVGTYTVTVTDANGCTKTKVTTITQPAFLSCSIAITKNPTCGICDGKARVTATGGTPAYHYSWNTVPVQTTRIATGLCAATYIVIVTDAKGCTTACSVTLTTATAPSCLITGNGSICSGSSTQWCSPAGASFYLWSTGATTQCITVSIAGTYTVTTTNSSGCSSNCNKILIVNAPPSCTITGSSSVCLGSTQWCAPAGLAGYLWSTGATTQCITVSTSGTYTVTVTDANGCTSSCSKIFTAGVPPSCLITGNGSVCSGSSAQWCAPTGLAAYLWSTGATTQCITVSTAATYTVTVTDVNGCTSSCNKILVVNPLPGCLITGNGSVCSGSATQWCAPAGLATYSWSTGATTQCVIVSTAGTYTVTVTDANGCSSSCSKTLTVNPLPTCLITGNGSICSGSLTQWCAPAGLASYLWSSGATTQCITVSTAGTYTVTVTDANGCTSSCNKILIVNPLPGCLITGNGSVCSGTSTQWCAPAGLTSYLWSTGATTQCITVSVNGTYTVTVTDANGCSSNCSKSLVTGAPPSCLITGNSSVCSGSGTQWCAPAGLTSYSWSTGATTQCVIVSVASTYTVTVTDANGCSSSCSKILTVNPLPTCLITGNGSICSGSSTQWCAPAGLASYLWNSGATTQCITVSAAGTYIVTVTDANGCTSSCNKILIVNPLPGCLITGNGSVCSGTSTQWCAPAGLTSYLWSTGATTQCITVSVNGTYTVTVTDANGCSSNCSKSLVTGAPPSCLITGNSSVCSGSGTQWCAPAGLTSYSWSTGATTQCVIVSVASTYTVTVTDANGCSSSCIKTLTVNPLPTCLITGNSSICSGSSTQWCAPAGLASYLWNSGATTQCITVSTAGTYTVTVTDANGCTSSCNKILTVNPLPGCLISGNGSICSGSSAQWCAPIGLSSYLWSTGATTQCIIVSSAGTYTVTVTDANGCSSSCNKVLTVNPLPSCLITGNSSICSGSSTQWCAPAGLASYLWSTGATTQCITVITAGTYTVTVTDANGCSSSCNKVLTVNPLPSCLITGNSSICSGSSTQWCAPAGLASYSWSTGATTQCITVSTAGTYTVTVTNANGCSSSCIKTLTVNPLPSCLITGNGSICSGSSTQWCAPAGLTSYSWSTGATTQCITVSTAGTYTVTVTDANGCSSSCNKTLTINTPPSCLITGSGSICSGSTQWCAPAGLASYLWSTGATTQCISVSAAGTYTVTVTDANGCTSSCTKALTTGTPPSCLITGNSSVCSGGSTQWCAPAGLASYLWSTGATTQCITVSTAGTYTVTVTNSGGCSSSCTKALTVNALPACSISGKSVICSGESTQECAPAGLSSYLWSTGSTTQCITISAAGTYTVTVTNASGCTSSCTKVVTSSAAPACSFTWTGTTCPCALFCATPGMSGYLWNTGATTQCIEICTTTDITVTVTNSGGCTSSCSLKIIAQPLPTCLITGNSTVCSGCSTPWCAPSGMSAYLWNTGATTQCINVSTPGSYTVTITNSNGCSSSCSKALSIARMANFYGTGQNNGAGIESTAYPNPFNSITTIEFMRSDKAAHATIEIYTLSGTKVTTVFDGDIEAQVKYQASFNAKDLADGIYMYRLITGDYVINEKLILIRQ